ncbi:MAG: hypothetical protein GF317_12455 [Candidatus Lokiarchaeota archaeon]|nr:hypothetical protein [Candidatus Lokiarchaeota archaeon]MBD3200458.1 hypothetical protein [Candidatus Lokiarchaeota archaeon]
MWEWRIFLSKKEYESLDINDLYGEKLNRTSAEIRADYYFNLQKKSLGLKERGSRLNKNELSYLELKVLKRKEKWGAEFWEKPIKHKLIGNTDADQGLSRRDIVKIIKGHKEGLQLPSNEFDYIISQLNDTNLKRIRVLKNRKQFSDSYSHITQENLNLKNYYKFERTKIIIENQIFHTYCFECEHIDVIKTIFENHFKSIRRGKVYGYPEFIAQFDQ